MNHGPEFQQTHLMMHPQHQHPQQQLHHHAYTSDRSNPYGVTMGTLRSTKSVPALAMHPHHHQQHGSGGDGCPVHGQELSIRHPNGAYSVIHAPIYADRRMLHAANSVIDLRSLPPLPPPMPPPSHMQSGAAMMTNFEAKKLQTAIQLPLPQMYPGSAAAAAAARQIQMMQHHRKQQQICSPLDLYGVTGTHTSSGETSCCKGHLIVLWIILGVVTLGVISGIVLGVTMN